MNTPPKIGARGHRFSAALLAAAIAMSFGPAQAQAVEPARPNFLVIVADDLGFSDLGAFGGEIDTPNLDALAMAGVRFTGFHAAPTCSPTRAMLLTGADNHTAGLGTMSELIAANQRGQPGYEGYLRADVRTVAERLSAAGYRTLYSGKWHLGVTPEQDPSRRGFQHSFVLAQASHDHFGGYLVTDPTPGDSVSGATYRRNGVTLTSLPADFYSSDAFATELIAQIKSTRAGRDGRKPFFAYLPFTAPHYPLQARAETIAKYKGRYDEGYDLLRERRLKRQVELGLLDPKTLPHPMAKGPRWATLSAADKASLTRRMEIYAAMVDSVDMNVGRVIAALKETGEYDNTVIFFLSDNGAEAVDSETSPGATMRARVARSDRRFEAMGGPDTFPAYGPGWAGAATAPSWLYKASVSEGGTRVTAFVTGKGLGKPGSIDPTFASVMDITPTMLDLAGAPKTDKPGKTPIQPIRGRSWVPYLRGQEARIYPADQPVGMHLFSERALRQGDWKLIDAGDETWRLFNIAHDPGETVDLSAKEPARKAELLKAYEAFAKEVNVILPEPRAAPR